MKLVLIGIQGSGKSTQGNMLSKQLKIPYLSTGHIFREIAKEKSPLGRFVKETSNAGFLIPDEKTVPIVEEYLSRPEYKKGYIIDGFPRTIDQVKQFKNNIDKVIYLDVPEKEALWRIAYRNDDSRADETLPAVKKRIELFHKVTTPVIEFYNKKGKLVVVDGTKSIEDVNKEILKSLGKELIKNRIRTWEQKQKIIIALVGMLGSGKSEASKYFASKNIPVVRFNQVNEYIDKHKLEHNRENHRRVREELRANYGLEAMAFLNVDKIAQALKKNTIIVIENMRSWEEYTYLKKTFGEVRVVLLGLHVDKRLRYERASKRKYLNSIKPEDRDIDELMGANMGPTIAYCDYLIVNDSSIEDFHDRLEHVYRLIYFS